jgi:hypothetical protein
MGLDGDPKISDQRIPPCLPAPVPTEGGAGRYEIFSGIPVKFWTVRVCNWGITLKGGVARSIASQNRWARSPKTHNPGQGSATGR